MFRKSWPLAMLAAAIAASSSFARAHEIVGNRFFPATLAVDDPGVNDELALPTIARSKSGDDPAFRQLDISAEFAKRITEDFGVSFAPTWSRVYAPGGPNMSGARGFQNLETTLKYRLFRNAEHEFVLSAGLEIEWGGTGARQLDAERFNVYTPTLYFGKGFGGLPSSLNWARPFAITGQIGVGFPTRSSTTTTADDDEIATKALIQRAGLKVHDLVNLESDMLGKYVLRALDFLKDKDARK